MAAITGKAVRNIRKIERPRPLKSSGSVEVESPVLKEQFFPDSITTKLCLTAEDVIKDLDYLTTAVTNGNFDENTNSIILRLISPLKHLGHQLEVKYKDQMDLYFKTLRNVSREAQLDLQVRARLLEIIELRANNWGAANIMYYHQKLIEPINPASLISLSSLMTSSTLPANFVPGQNFTSPSHNLAHSTTQILTAGEVLKNSGKFSRPTKIPGKNYFKDEVVIRNSDSGKVSPGTRDRLVQITGPSDECIDRAKILIEETIRRNASPVREPIEIGLVTRLGSESSTSLNSTTSEESLGNAMQHQSQHRTNNMFPLPEDTSIGKGLIRSVSNQNINRPNKKALVHSHSTGDASLGEYNYTVSVGQETIRIAGAKVELVRTAKLVLEEYFAGQAKLADMQIIRDNMAIINQRDGPALNHNFNHNEVFHSPVTSNVFPPASGYSKVQGFQTKTQLSGKLSQDSSSNGQPLTSSSEDDTTLKAGENSPPTDEDLLTQPKQVELTRDYSLVKIKASHSLVFQENESKERSELSKTNESELNKKSSIGYTRDFLMKCGTHPICKNLPKDAAIIAEIAPIILRRVYNFCFASVHRDCSARNKLN